MNNLFSLDSKMIIVTGSSGDIGKVIYEALKNYGAKVYGISKRESVTTDFVSDIRDISKLKVAIRQFNKIDGLINCTGITGEDWDTTLDINLNAMFKLMNEVLAVMKKNKRGSIINVTSINSMVAFPSNPQYVASKGGLKMLTKALALDYGKYSIRLNNLCPGYIKTKMTSGSYSDQVKRDKIADKTMLNRWGMPEDLIGACLFLMSDASEYVTGTDIVVDGGWLAKGL